jgi:tetratricopeptide (TPR) repeat protein
MQGLLRATAIWPLLLILTATAFSEEDWVGEQIMPKEDAEYTNRGDKVSRELIALPARVQKTNGNYFWIGNAWVSKDDVLKLDDALKYYDAKLRDNPTSEMYSYRAFVLIRRQDYVNALKDLTEALKLNPKSSAAYNTRANLYLQLKEYDNAISDYTEAIRLLPTSIGYSNRGQAYSRMKQYKNAKADFTKALSINYLYARALNERAWLLATCPDSNVRDGKQAVLDAIELCKSEKYTDGAHIDTLAAAYAETGDFESAVIWEEEAIETDSIESERQELRANLALFRQKKPVRDPN